MQNIIPIRQSVIGSEEVNSVNARELYQVLEIKRQFADWIKAQIDSLGLEDNIDYATFHKKVNGGKFAPIEYIITLDTAKHIALASRTQKGKEVRKYFIEVEKKFLNNFEKGIKKKITYETVIANLAMEQVKKIDKDIFALKKELMALSDKRDIYLRVININMSKRALSPRAYSQKDEEVIFEMRRQGYGYADIAQKLGKTVSSVKNKIYRLKAKGIV